MKTEIIIWKHAGSAINFWEIPPLTKSPYFWTNFLKVGLIRKFVQNCGFFVDCEIFLKFMADPVESTKNNSSAFFSKYSDPDSYVKCAF